MLIDGDNNIQVNLEGQTLLFTDSGRRIVLRVEKDKVIQASILQNLLEIIAGSSITYIVTPLRKVRYI